MVTIFIPIAVFFVIKIVPEYQKAVIFRFGKVNENGANGPGLLFVIPFVDAYIPVDMRMVSFKIPGKKMLTKDSVTVIVDGVVCYRIVRPVDVLTKVSNASKSTRFMAQAAIRTVLGQRSYSKLLTDRTTVSAEMHQLLATATGPWGIQIDRMEIKDVRLPPMLQRPMDIEATTARLTKSKVTSQNIV